MSRDYGDLDSGAGLLIGTLCGLAFTGVLALVVVLVVAS